MTESGTSVQTPPNFKLKKTILIVVMIVEIAYCIYAFFEAKKSAESMLANKPASERTEENLKSLTNGFRAGAVIGALFNLLMFYGIEKHHICLVTTLVVLNGISAFFAVLGFFFGGGGLITVALTVILAIVGYLFLKDIRLMRDQERAGKMGRGAA